MSHPPTALPPHLLPRSKAPSTSASSTSLDALARRSSTRSTPHSSRASSQAPSQRQSSPPARAIPAAVVTHATIEGRDEAATKLLIRRVLCPQSSQTAPIEALLPPLTSSNEVDLQLYAILAIVVRDFVYTWYGKITPDQTFVEEVIKIFAHCTRGLEQRLRKVDVQGLVLDEIPALAEQHVSAFRASHTATHLPQQAKSSPKVIYHTLLPHPAFSPVPDPALPSTIDEQAANETAYRQLLVQGVLAVLLPSEDLGNACVRTLVADIIADMILGNGVGGKACEGWLMWDGIAKAVASLRARAEPKVTGEEIEIDTRSRLERFGLLSGQQDEKEEARQSSRRGNTRSSRVSEVLWRLLQYLYLTFVAIRFTVTGMAAARSARRTNAARDRGNAQAPMTTALDAPTLQQAAQPAVLRYRLFSLISTLLEMRSRTPWLVGSLSLARYHLTNRAGWLAGQDGVFDLFLHSLVDRHLLRPALVPQLLQTVRAAIFPGNALGPSRVAPSPEEQMAIKKACAEALLSLVPPAVARRFFAISGAAGEEHDCMVREVEDVLDVFGTSYMNKHLVFGIVELVMVRLVPEIGEKSVRVMVEERIGST